MWSAIVSKVHPGIVGLDGEHEQSLSHRRREGGGLYGILEWIAGGLTDKAGGDRRANTVERRYVERP